MSWPQTKAGVGAPVYIEVGNGVEDILADAYIPTLLKSPEIKILGVIVDADRRIPDGRYQRLKQLCLSQFPQMPMSLPTSGLIVNDAFGKRLGFWPDNLSPGSLETFLRYLVPVHANQLWQHAEKSVVIAKATHGAACRDSHVEKANLYTWLAWQDPPTQSPGMALTAKILDPHAGQAGPFVTWFKNLYDF
jgi:hypothetical protein